SSTLEDNKLKKPITSHLMKFSKPAVNNINIAESKRYPLDENLYPYEPSQRWSQDKHIELVNIIGNPEVGMLTRAMAKQLSTALAHEFFFVDFLAEEEPKKVSEALKHLGWVDVMQDELNQFTRNEVWTLVPAPYGKTIIGARSKKSQAPETIMSFIKRVENQNDIKVKQLRTGNESSTLEDNKLKKPITSHLMKFSKLAVNNINIAESERYPLDEYLHPYEPSQRYQTNINDVSFIESCECPKPVVLETNVSSDQNNQTYQNDETKIGARSVFKNKRDKP
nr:retrovirus-related Pol polyprotein from transposon TNT 1-94 [Tanacetum cinerariifolium]